MDLAIGFVLSIPVANSSNASMVVRPLLFKTSRCGEQGPKDSNLRQGSEAFLQCK